MQGKWEGLDSVAGHRLTSSPDGKKKAYVRLTADHDALEVANKVSFRRIFRGLVSNSGGWGN